MHKLDIIHRDVKPENLLVTHDDRVIMTDLDTVRRLTKKDGIYEDQDPIGTLVYMDP